MKKLVLLSPKDNVAVAAQDIEKGDECSVIGKDSFLIVQEKVSFGHKIALQGIASGEAIVKYGETIALAKNDITQGTHVHTHNMLNIIE